jgi:mycoredoxin
MHPVAPVVVERSRSVSSSPQDSTVSIVSIVTMYSTVWCGYCRRLKDQMDREGITFEVVDIEHDAAAAELVMSVNGGNQTVPTLVFPDGSALTNPSIKDVKAKLAA